MCISGSFYITHKSKQLLMLSQVLPGNKQLECFLHAALQMHLDLNTESIRQPHTGHRCLPSYVIDPRNEPTIPTQFRHSDPALQSWSFPLATHTHTHRAKPAHLNPHTQCSPEQPDHYAALHAPPPYLKTWAITP